MNPESSKLRHQQNQETTAAQSQTTSGGLEFAAAEEALRHDAAHTEPPDAIIERLNRSLAAEPLPKASWWQKLFSR